MAGAKRTAAPKALDRVRPADLVWLATFLVFFAILVARNYFLGQTQIPTWRYGPITLGPFGLFAALDILFGYYLVHRWCVRLGLDWDTLASGLVWIVGLSYYVSHLVSITFYRPEYLTGSTGVDRLKEKP